MKKRKNKGFFVTFEGGEGAGKTTLIDHVYDYLISKKNDVIKTREPGGTELGHSIRKLLLHQNISYPSKRAELLLFLADRAHHVEELIYPALNQNKIVLCDRFNDSTLAYQGAARSFNSEILQNFCSFSSNNLEPNLTLFLDLDPELGLKRAKDRKENSQDRLEKEKMPFHVKVREAFLSFAKLDPQRFRVINASEPPNVVFNLALKEINEALCLNSIN